MFGIRQRFRGTPLERLRPIAAAALVSPPPTLPQHHLEAYEGEAFDRPLEMMGIQAHSRLVTDGMEGEGALNVRP